MSKEEMLAIADGVVEIHFDENMSVKGAIELCRRKEGETYESKMDRRTIS